jgi:hypothetical protein
LFELPIASTSSVAQSDVSGLPHDFQDEVSHSITCEDRGVVLSGTYATPGNMLRHKQTKTCEEASLGYGVDFGYEPLQDCLSADEDARQAERLGLGTFKQQFSRMHEDQNEADLLTR